MQGEILRDDVPSVDLADSATVAELDGLELGSSRVYAKELLGCYAGHGLRDLWSVLYGDPLSVSLGSPLPEDLLGLCF